MDTPPEPVEIDDMVKEALSGEAVNASHLAWLQRECYKLMRRQVEVGRREEIVAQREAALAAPPRAAHRRSRRNRPSSDATNSMQI